MEYKFIGLQDPEKGFEVFTNQTRQLENHELLIKVTGISINPVDTSTASQIKEPLSKPLILGFDGIGVVTEVGPNTELFKVGDRVFWAGDYTKDGSYSEYQYVDERIVGIAPKISDELAVSLPLTSLTAYEALFEKIGESNLKSSPSLLIINGAGGVGSIAIQMAKNAGMKVIATASRPETIDWVKELGADIIIDHHQSLVDQLSGFDIHSVDNVLYLASMAPTWQEVAELIAPNGNIVSVTGGQVDINYGQLKQKAVNYKWEWMFSKAKFKYNEISQHEILNLVSKQVEVGQIVPTTKKVLNGLTVENINASHNLIKSGQSIGKIVIMF